MQRWEYRIVCLNEDELFKSDEGSESLVLNKYGAEGWELAAIVESRLDDDPDVYAYFKRPVMSTEASHA